MATGTLQELMELRASIEREQEESERQQRARREQLVKIVRHERSPQLTINIHIHHGESDGD
jgi:hypothetical protein